MTLHALLRRLGARPAGRTPDQVRADLRARHAALTRLTAANTAALEVLADLQAKASGDFLFDYKYVRDSAAAALAHGAEVVDSLRVLTDGAEAQLTRRLEELQAAVIELLRSGTPLPDAPPTLPLSQVARADRRAVGEKMRRLAVVRGLGLPAPDGFALTTSGCHQFLAQRGLWESVRETIGSLSIVDRASLVEASRAIRARVTSTPWPPALAEVLLGEFDVLEARTRRPGLKVAVRSSAADEDGVHSFAGQYTSVLNVGREGLLAACTEVIASQFGPRAVVYYKSRGLDATLLPMSLGVVTMIDGRTGGVLYTRSPTEPEDDAMVIAAVWGLGALAVEGKLAPDLYVLARGEAPRLLRTTVASKRRMLVCRPGGETGVVEVDVPGWMRERPCLTSNQLDRLVSMAATLEEHFGTALDVEFATDESEAVSILQARPLRIPAEPSRTGDWSAARAALPAPLAQGMVGSPGVAAGPVVFPRLPAAAESVPRGAVLVARTASPELAVVLDRAAALVVETGSLASHLATVARELGLPALFNVTGALARLPEGRVVSVDAEMGSVYEGRHDALIRASAARKREPAFAAAPLFGTLRSVMALLVPLDLTDPRSRRFKPSGCRTLHDVLRYAHETAIRRLFLAGTEAADAGGLGLRLVGLPLDFHVIDLGGGLAAERDGATVAPEDVRSRPFTPLWRGMTSVPWDLRPAADGASAASLVFSALTSPAGAAADAGQPNYLILADTYVNMHVHFGYHFSRVDAFLSEAAEGNYASLLFHGGGADGRRRERRLEVVTRVLQTGAWTVARRGDALWARVQGLGPEPLGHELDRLGRLLVATRQLDVQLVDDAAVEDAVRACSGDPRAAGGREPVS